MGLPRSSLVKKPAAEFKPVVSATAPTVLERALTPAAAAEPVPIVVAEAPRPPQPSIAEPSPAALVDRAAGFSLVRRTWESIVLSSTDPILDEKQLPRVAERRRRFTRVVKATLGACVALCVAALVVTLASSGDGTASAATETAVEKTVPSRGVVTVESLQTAQLAKAPSYWAHNGRRASVTAKHR